MKIRDIKLDCYTFHFSAYNFCTPHHRIRVSSSATKPFGSRSSTQRRGREHLSPVSPSFAVGRALPRDTMATVTRSHPSSRSIVRRALTGIVTNAVESLHGTGFAEASAHSRSFCSKSPCAPHPPSSAQNLHGHSSPAVVACGHAYRHIQVAGAFRSAHGVHVASTSAVNPPSSSATAASDGGKATGEEDGGARAEDVEQALLRAALKYVVSTMLCCAVLCCYLMFGDSAGDRCGGRERMRHE